jgi:biopolymer transport protein TolR
MGMAAGGKSGQLNSDINVTPLVDVVLVLLIIFMVVVPLSQMGYDVNVPKESVKSVPQEQVEKQIILAVNADHCAILENLGPSGLPPGCAVFLNHERVAIEDLPRRVGEIFANRRAQDQVLFLAAEERLNYEGVIRIVDIARSGLTGDDELRIGIVSDERLSRPPDV